MSIVPPPSPRPSGAYGGEGFYQGLQPNRKVLAAGTAPNAITTVYTVPLRTQCEITWLSVHNYNAGAQTLDLTVRFNGGTGYNIRRFSLNANTSNNNNLDMGGGRIMLGPQWELRLTASAAAAIDYLITGIEWTLPGGGATA